MDTAKMTRDSANRLFTTHIVFVHSVAYRVAPSAELVDDIVNDVYVNFIENANRFDLSRDVRPLLAKMTRNIARNHWRNFMKDTSARLEQIFDYLRTGEDRTEQYTDVYEELEHKLLALESCRRKLKVEYCQILDSYYQEGLPLVHIAEQYNIKVRTLSKMLCRIREQLRFCMEKFLQSGENHVG